MFFIFRCLGFIPIDYIVLTLPSHFTVAPPVDVWYRIPPFRTIVLKTRAGNRSSPRYIFEVHRSVHAGTTLITLQTRAIANRHYRSNYRYIHFTILFVTYSTKWRSLFSPSRYSWPLRSTWRRARLNHWKTAGRKYGIQRRRATIHTVREKWTYASNNQEWVLFHRFRLIFINFIFSN